VLFLFCSLWCCGRPIKIVFWLLGMCQGCTVKKEKEKPNRTLTNWVLRVQGRETCTHLISVCSIVAFLFPHKTQAAGPRITFSSVLRLRLVCWLCESLATGEPSVPFSGFISQGRLASAATVGTMSIFSGALLHTTEDQTDLSKLTPYRCEVAHCGLSSFPVANVSCRQPLWKPRLE